MVFMICNGIRQQLRALPVAHSTKNRRVFHPQPSLRAATLSEEAEGLGYTTTVMPIKHKLRGIKDVMLDLRYNVERDCIASSEKRAE